MKFCCELGVKSNCQFFFKYSENGLKGSKFVRGGTPFLPKTLYLQQKLKMETLGFPALQLRCEIITWVKTQIHLSSSPSFRTCSIHDHYKRDQLINPKDGKIEERSTRGGGYELPKAKYYVPSKLLEITTHFKAIVNFASSFKNLKLMPYPAARKKKHFSLNYKFYPWTKFLSKTKCFV